eukprot:TRINITY_DN6689_c0_g3_i1.p1 TRINITY_DN6689_c0_g3~~TRINITY_DN6689_c0_g3_i1.p1  ORF type:complete len:878 (-),score=223.69 TRINITY_DN6689_c0_g3_i1:98-2731(-)
MSTTLGPERPTRKGTEATAFESYPDFSRMNTSRHNAIRADTFKTSQPLIRKSPIPIGRGDMAIASGSGAGGGGQEIQDILGICEMSISKHFRLVREDFKRDLVFSAQMVCKEMQTYFQAMGANMQADIIAKVEATEMSSSQLGGDTLKLSRNAEESCREILGSVADLKASLESEARRAEERQVKLSCEFSALHHTCLNTNCCMERVETLLSKIDETQKSLSASTAASFADSKRALKGTSDRLIDNMGRVEGKLMEGLESLGEVVKSQEDNYTKVDLQSVITEIGTQATSATAEFSKVHEELGKINKMMHHDREARLHAASCDSLEEGYGGGDPMPESGKAGNSERGGFHHSSTFPHSMFGQQQHHHRRHRAPREMGVQTAVETNSTEVQTDPNLSKPHKKKKREKFDPAMAKSGTLMLGGKGNLKRAQGAVFADVDQMKQDARKEMLEPQYEVSDLYHETGRAQAIATSPWFNALSLLVILANTLWFAIDADFNKEAILSQASPVFIVAENMFCIFFFVELVVRFCAFQSKLNAFKDMWFCFDSMLVLLMIVETWILPAVVFIMANGGAVLKQTSALRIVRMIKIVRIGRMGKLLREFPELMIMIKGMRAALRSLLVFILLWFLIIYVYALVFRMILEENTVQFENVLEAMYTLMVEGLMPNHATFLGENNSVVFKLLMVSFICLAVWVLMNMLIGVLVELVSAVSLTEKESFAVQYLVGTLRLTFEDMDMNVEEAITKNQFVAFLQDPNVVGAIRHVGSDVSMLRSMAEPIYEEYERYGGIMTFGHFVDLILDMRGNNNAKVKHVKEQFRFAKQLSVDTASTVLKDFGEAFSDMKTEIAFVRSVLQEVQDAVVEESSDEEKEQDPEGQGPGAEGQE